MYRGCHDLGRSASVMPVMPVFPGCQWGVPGPLKKPRARLHGQTGRQAGNRERAPLAVRHKRIVEVTDSDQGPLTWAELDLIDAWWRAANYLSVGQIYPSYRSWLRRRPGSWVPGCATWSRPTRRTRSTCARSGWRATCLPVRPRPGRHSRHTTTPASRQAEGSPVTAVDPGLAVDQWYPRATCHVRTRPPRPWAGH